MRALRVAMMVRAGILSGFGVRFDWGLARPDPQ